MRGYPGWWVYFLDGGPNLTVTELLEQMDCIFGHVHKYNTMIRSLYEIRQKEGEFMEEYMLHDLAQDRFYHGLAPSLRDALEFAMAELPEREQASASFDMLYMLAKKMEARQPSCMHRGQGSSDAYQDKYRRYPTPTGQVAMLAEELLLPDPEPLDPGVPELDIIEGLSLRMIQAMNHYLHEEHCCFVWSNRPIHMGLSTLGGFPHLA